MPYAPPTLVVVTPIVRVALAPLPPTIVKVHVPAPTGVTVNELPPVAAIVAIPLHEPAPPAAAVAAVKLPLYPA